MLQPLPDREEFERRIRELIRDGEIENTARFLQLDRTGVSRMLSPTNPERHNPFWFTTAFLWAFDAQRDGLSQSVLGEITRTRQMWLPAPFAEIDRAAAIEEIGRQLFELVQKEIAGAPDHVLVKEAGDVTEAVERYVNGVLARRGQALAART